MMNETPEAALRSRIADLEQQLKSADEGVSRLASRCLALEKEVESYRAAHPQREMHTDSPPFCSRCSITMRASASRSGTPSLPRTTSAMS